MTESKIRWELMMKEWKTSVAWQTFWLHSKAICWKHVNSIVTNSRNHSYHHTVRSMCNSSTFPKTDGETVGTRMYLGLGHYNIPARLYVLNGKNTRRYFLRIYLSFLPYTNFN